MFTKGFNLYVSAIKYYPYKRHMVFSAWGTLGFLSLQQETVFFSKAYSPFPRTSPSPCPCSFSARHLSFPEVSFSMPPPVQTSFPCPKQCFSSSPTSSCCLLPGESSPSVSPPHLLTCCAAQACPTTALTGFSCGLAAFLVITPNLFIIIC